MKRILKERLRHLPGLVHTYRYANIILNLHRLAVQGYGVDVALPERLSAMNTLRLARFASLSQRIPGWERGEEALALELTSYRLPEGAVVVEIGSFLGSSAVLLAGARKVRGSGKVHCIDPFDNSGDPFSAPIYREIRESQGVPLRQAFEENIRRAGLTEWAEVHPAIDLKVVQKWVNQIDLLFLDGDQSYGAVQATYRSWSPFLKIGGILAVHNSSQGVYAEGHDGSKRLVEESIRSPQYTCVRCIGSTTFAIKAAHHAG